MSIQALKLTGGDIPTAAKQNGILDHLLRQRFLGGVANLREPRGYPHPWEVTSGRFEPPESGATLAPESTWRIDVAAGTINDQLACLPYLRQHDPRGWSIPADYAAATSDSPWIDRDPLDDPEDLPFLIARDPGPNAKIAYDFTLVTDDQRLNVEGGAFCSGAEWELELWRAHVLLSAVPLSTTFVSARFPPPALRRFRLYVSKSLPPINYVAQSGGTREIATLYLLRDPKDPSASAELFPRQRVWFPLWSVIIQPGGDILSLVEPEAAIVASAPGFGDAYAAILQGVAGALENILSETATVEFWTV